jgi:hypothetical protein
MVDHSGPNLYKPHDTPGGALNQLTLSPPERRIPNHVQQIVGKTSDEKPCLIGCEAMATCFVPPEGVLPLFYPVFDLSPSIVNRNDLVRFKIRVGHNKSGTGEEFTHMPFNFTDNPSRYIPTRRPVMKFDHPYLCPALWGTTDGPLQVRLDERFEAVVGGDANEAGDAHLFAEFV